MNASNHHSDEYGHHLPTPLDTSLPLTSPSSLKSHPDNQPPTHSTVSPPKTLISRLALLSLVFSLGDFMIFGLLVFLKILDSLPKMPKWHNALFLFSISPCIAVILGHLANSQIRKNPHIKGKRMATIGLWIGYFILGHLTFFIIWIFFMWAFFAGILHYVIFSIPLIGCSCLCLILFAILKKKR